PCVVCVLVARPRPPRPTRFPYTTLFRSSQIVQAPAAVIAKQATVLSSSPSPPHARRVSAALPTISRTSPVRSQRPGASDALPPEDRKSTRLNSSHVKISYAVFCLKKKKG